MRPAVFLLLLSALCSSPSAADVTARPDTTTLVEVVVIDTSARGPVVLGKDTLFVVAVGMRGFPAERRAATISERIREVVDDQSVSLDSIAIIEGEIATEVSAGGRHLVSVYDVEGALAGRTRA